MSYPKGKPYPPYPESAKIIIGQKSKAYWSSPKGLAMRRFLSETRKGKLNPNYGRIYTNEERKEMSVKLTGKIRTEEQKLRYSESKKGEKNPWYGIRNNPGFLVMTKVIESNHPMLGKHHTEETKQKIRTKRKGQVFSEEMRQKSSISHKNYYSKLSSEEKTQVIRKRRTGCAVTKPTKPEKQLGQLLNQLFPNEYLYVGNNSFLIEGKNPDWVNVNGKKILIELFGTYWHSENKTGRTKEEEENERIEIFSKYGYKTLIIWESELENRENLIKKIKNFGGG